MPPAPCCASARRAPRGRCARSRPCAPFGSSTLDSAKMLRTSSSTTRMRRPSSAASRSRAAFSMRWRSGGSCRLDLVQEQRHLVEQPLGRARVLDDDRLREAPQPLLLVARQRAAGVDDDRRERHVVLLGHLSRAARSRSGPAGSGPSPCSRRSSRCSWRERLGGGLDAGDLRRRRCRAAAGCSRAAARRPRRRARGAGSARTSPRAAGRPRPAARASPASARSRSAPSSSASLRVVGDRERRAPGCGASAGCASADRARRARSGRAG